MIQLYLTFFRNTWCISIPTGIGISSLSGIISGDILMNSLYLIPTVGLGMDFFYKELAHKEDYFFYYNQGISKIRLWVITFLLSAGSCFILYLLIRLCVHVWKLIVS